MQLTKIDRILLANQYRILEKLDPANAEIYANNCKVLENGFSLNYAALDQRFKDGLSSEQCSEVIQILLMFEALHQGYLRSKDALEADLEAITFHGFDEASEGDLLAYAAYLMQDEGRFHALERQNLDSAVPMLATYRKMLWEWEKSADKHNLDADDLVRIGRARERVEETPVEAVWHAFAPRGFPPPVALSSGVTDPRPGGSAGSAETRKGGERKLPQTRKRPD